MNIKIGCANEKTNRRQRISETNRLALRKNKICGSRHHCQPFTISLSLVSGIGRCRMAGAGVPSDPFGYGDFIISGNSLLPRKSGGLFPRLRPVCSKGIRVSSGSASVGIDLVSGFIKTKTFISNQFVKKGRANI